MTKIFRPNMKMLAPLAGVSDHPFRRICVQQGADLTYVEMLSATALIHGSRNTFRMLKRHSTEAILGVQLTAKTPEEMGQAVAILDGETENFDTIDINMGCPVTKVVKTGCGSAILKDPARVRATVAAARANTKKPLSVKIRLGWDRPSINAVEVAKAIEDAGADWLTVHGRTRSDDYSVPVDLAGIAAVKAAVKIPVVGNGNLFSRFDADYMQKLTKADAVMVSRGALGDPWVFRRLKGDESPVTLDEWRALVVQHLEWQAEEYGPTGTGALCMRKHLLWYARGWPGVRPLREKLTGADDLVAAKRLIEDFADDLAQRGINFRDQATAANPDQTFSWDPKFDMDRQLDRGVGDEA